MIYRRHYVEGTDILLPAFGAEWTAIEAIIKFPEVSTTIPGYRHRRDEEGKAVVIALFDIETKTFLDRVPWLGKQAAAAAEQLVRILRP